jgi:hypothetical protein
MQGKDLFSLSQWSPQHTTATGKGKLELEPRGADQVYLIRNPVPWSAGQIMKNTSGQLGNEFLRIRITRTRPAIAEIYIAN